MPKSLLVADDSITIRKVIGMILSTEDFQIVSVDNGLEAISKARELRPDLVLADVTMPGKSGYEVCEAIKADPGMHAVPVLLLAGTFEPFDEKRARAVKADDYIVKPFESNAFLEKVRTLTGAPRQAEVPRQVFVAESAASGSRPAAPAKSSGPIPATSTSFPGSAGPPRPSAPAYALGQSPAGPNASAPPPGVRPSAPMPVPQPLFTRPPTSPASARGPVPGYGNAGVSGNPGAPQARPPSAVPRPAPAMPPSPGGNANGPAAGAFRPTAASQAVRAPPAPPPGAAARPPPGSIPRAPFPAAQVAPATPYPGPRMAAQPAYSPQSQEPQRREAPSGRVPPAARPDGGEALLREALSKASREVIERVVWEVVPQLAENIIREHLDQLLKNREARS